MSWINILGIILFVAPIIGVLIISAIENWQATLISILIVAIMIFGLYLAGAFG